MQEKIMSKTKCDAVKLEGGKKIINIVKFLIKNKIPVMGTHRFITSI